MCKLKSGLLFKNGVFVPDYDNHTKMLEEKGIADTAENRMLGKFVRFELHPKNGDPFTPVEDWEFVIDQDELPEWLQRDPKKYEDMARDEVSKWAKTRIFDGVADLRISAGDNYYLRDCENAIVYSGTFERVHGGTFKQVYAGTFERVHGGTFERVHGGTFERVYAGTFEWVDGGTFERVHGGTFEQVYVGTFEAVDGGTFERVHGGTFKQVYGGTFEAVDGGTFERVHGGTFKQVYGGTFEWVDGVSPNITISRQCNRGLKVEDIKLSNGATIKDLRTKTLYANGDWKLVNVGG